MEIELRSEKLRAAPEGATEEPLIEESTWEAEQPPYQGSMLRGAFGHAQGDSPCSLRRRRRLPLHSERSSETQVSGAGLKSARSLWIRCTSVQVFFRPLATSR